MRLPSFGVALAAFLLGSATHHPAADVLATPPPLGPIRPYLIALSVPDASESVAWYRDNLAFRLLRDSTLSTYHVRIADMVRDSVHLDIVQLEASRAPAQLVPGLDDPALIQGFGKVALRVPDAASWAQRLRKAGIRFQMPLRRDTVQHSEPFIVLDNSGNWLHFSQGEP